MAEIEGARQELDRAAECLRAELHRPAVQLTPAQGPDLYMPSDPFIVGWHELLYQHHATARIERPAEHYDATLATRAASLLTSAGWQVTDDVTDAGSDTELATVTADRDGFRVRVRIQRGFGGVVYRGQTPAMSLYTPESFVRPDPVRTPETVRRGYVLCDECDGLGWCPVCEGRGWCPNEQHGRKRCPECYKDRLCPICQGAGELEIAHLPAWKRDRYPELREVCRQIRPGRCPGIQAATQAVWRTPTRPRRRRSQRSALHMSNSGTTLGADTGHPCWPQTNPTEAHQGRAMCSWSSSPNPSSCPPVDTRMYCASRTESRTRLSLSVGTPEPDVHDSQALIPLVSICQAPRGQRIRLRSTAAMVNPAGAVVCGKRRVPVADRVRHGGAGSKEPDDVLVAPFALA